MGHLISLVFRKGSIHTIQVSTRYFCDEWNETDKIIQKYPCSLFSECTKSNFRRFLHILTAGIFFVGWKVERTGIFLFCSKLEFLYVSAFKKVLIFKYWSQRMNSSVVSVMFRISMFTTRLRWIVGWISIVSWSSSAALEFFADFLAWSCSL